ncbi:hypothetical protein F2Q70_00016460 [Brassica cretica]|uniref:Uncharacterized protein n=1 Tax=Brassica cretica TaxID=69181 RepID=A0A8S9HUW4_BRACR|nr:hypothetical protein F2Q70_00016460 [Brassica cretica]KAF2597482.1 hypothetical protein F2Q68_00009423 [Brassica cretica]
MKLRQIPAQKVEALDTCSTLPKHIVSLKLFYVHVGFVFFLGLISCTTDPARVGWALFFHRLGPTSKVPGGENVIRGDSISIYSNNLKQTLVSDVRLTLIFIHKKMRKSPWICFRMLEKSNATGLNDQKANIEASESEADDKDKSEADDKDKSDS